MKKLIYLALLFYSFSLEVCFPQSYFEKIISTADTNLIPRLSNVLPLADSSFLILANNKKPYYADTTKLCILKISSTGAVIWQKLISTDSSIFGGYLSYADNGFIIAATTIRSPLVNQNISLILIKFDFNGDTLWTKTYPEGGWGNYIKQLYNGDYIVIGSGGPLLPGGQKPYIMRTDSVGNIIYYNKYSGGILGGDQFRGMAAPSGNMLLFDIGVPLTKIDSAGNVLWSAPVFDSSVSFYKAIETIDSAYMLIAYRQTKMLFIKINNLGDTLWTKGVGSSQSISGYAIIQLNDGGFAVCGEFVVSPVRSTLLIRTDSLANVLWSKIYSVDNSITQSDLSLSVTPDNGFIIQSAILDTITNTRKVVLIKTDSLGNSSCPTVNANLQNEIIPVNIDTIINISKFPVTVSSSSITIHNQNGYLTSINNCAALSNNEISNKDFRSISIYPNPATDEINISTSDDFTMRSLILFDLYGNKVMEIRSDIEPPFHIQNLAPGIYLYEICDNKGNVFHGKIIKQ